MKSEQLLIDQDKGIKEIPEGTVTAPRGFLAGGLHCGLKRRRLDLGWLISTVPAHAAGVYTTHLFQAAPLAVTKESIAYEQKLQGVIVNSGNANSCTGAEGMINAKSMQKSFAEAVGIGHHYVAVASTGIIGEPLPMAKINDGIAQISSCYKKGTSAQFEQAILTTDTGSKHAGVELVIDDKVVTIGGVAKGSGMIHPKMATMLGFITTDANVEPGSLQQALSAITQTTFNMITVDGDTSTNDMVLVLANGLAGNQLLTPQHPQWLNFVQALRQVGQSLAKQIARDGEGATKLIEVQVTGAKDQQRAIALSKSIIGSSLVKTAIFGEDPNWGRMLCALGQSDQLESREIGIAIGPVTVVEKGLPVSFSEAAAKAYLRNEVIHISVQLNEGTKAATAWGCDLTYDYVKINASYRT